MKTIRKIRPLALILFLLLSGSIIPSLPSESRDSANPQITAHRGNSWAAPENTLPALRSAIEAEADFVEIDVRMTADGIPVLSHDASLERIAGKPGNLQDYTYKELSSLDFGAWFSDSYQGEPIPTLEQAIKACKGKIHMNIELKSGENLTEVVLGLIKSYHMEEEVAISSANLQYLKEVKEKKPEIPTGYIASSPCPELLEEPSVDFFSVSSGWVTADFVGQAHRLGKEVHIWTVDIPEALLDADALHADNIITNRPELAKNLFP